MISVIIPVYNGAKYLEKCLRSVMEQSYRDLEIIVVDDGSKDNSAEICAKLAEVDSRIRLIRQENAGVSAARNRGMSLSRGEYITFLDCDDYLDGNMYSHIADYIAAHDAPDLVSTGAYYETEDGVVFTRQEGTGNSDITVLDSTLAFKHIFVGLLGTAIWNKCFRADIIRASELSFRGDIAYGEDMLFLCEFVSRSSKVAHIHRDYYHYVKRNTSVTNSVFSEKFLSVTVAYDEIERMTKEKYPQFLTDIYSGKAWQLCNLIYSLRYSDYAEKAKLIQTYHRWLRRHLYVIKKRGDFQSKVLILLISVSPGIGCFIWKNYKAYRKRKFAL